MVLFLTIISAVLDQYDGIINVHEPSFIGRWWDWKSKMLGHAKYGVDIFCTGILQAKEAKSMSWCLHQLILLLSCYKKIYYYDGKILDRESDFNKEVSERFFNSYGIHFIAPINIALGKIFVYV
jgi:hypothetical protein